LLENMARSPQQFEDTVGQILTWNEWLALFREKDGIEVPLILEQLHDSTILTGVPLLLNLLGHGIRSPPRDNIISWVTLLQRGFEESDYDYEEAYSDEHFIRIRALDSAVDVICNNPSTDSGDIKSAIRVLYSNDAVLPAMMVGVDLGFECIDLPNIRDSGDRANQTIMECLFDKIKNISKMENLAKIMNYIIEEHSHKLKAVGISGYDGTDSFLKLIDQKVSAFAAANAAAAATAAAANAAYAANYHPYYALVKNKNLINPERFNQLRLNNLLNSDEFIRILSYELNKKPFDGKWYEILRKSNYDWSI